MSFLNKIFSKKNEEIKFLMPLSGKLINIDKVPDPVFADKLTGDGFGIEPTGSQVFSPVDATIVTVFPTKHALGLKMKNGIEILIHIGLETVALKGEGFSVHVKEGDTVKAGDLLVDVDFKAISEKIPSTTTPIVFTAIEGYKFTPNYGTYEAKTEQVVLIEKI